MYQILESHKKKEKFRKSCAKSNLFYSKDFTFYKYHGITDFVDERSPDSKVNYLKDFKDELEEFYYDTVEIKLNNKAQEKDL